MFHWYRCITVCMGVLQKGHPLPMADTVFAQGEQKRACPHGTKATPNLGCIKQTSQVPVTLDAAGAVAASDGCWSPATASSSSVSDELLSTTWKTSAWRTECPAARRNCSLLKRPSSNLLIHDSRRVLQNSVLHFPVLHIPVLHFQRPQYRYNHKTNHWSQ